KEPDDITSPGYMGYEACSLVLGVVPLLQCVEQVGRHVRLALVLDLLVTAGLDDGSILERELVDGVRQVLLLHQHARESGWVEAERRAALQTLLVGVQVHLLEVLEGT